MNLNRRSTLTAALGGAVAGTMLLAGRPARAAADQATLDLSDYRARSLMLGSFSLETSRIALTRAHHPRVREFAGFERDEQLTVAQVLTDMAQPAPVPPDAAHAAMLQRLQAQEGRAFDTMFIEGQIQTHHDLMAVQQGYLNGRPTVADDRHIAMLARTTIEMHLTMLADLQNILSA